MLTNLKRFFLAYIALIVIFLSALILSSTIPSSFLSKNIGKSLEVFKEEGTYPSYGLVPWRKIVLDNYTEPLMFNIAFSIDSTQPVRSALTNMRNAESFEQLNQIVNLDKAYYQKAKQPIGYERYWHGYLVFLRPLLVFFSYEGIRNVITFLLYAGLTAFVFLSWKKLGKINTVIFLLGLLAVDFFSISRSLQFSSVFLIGIWMSVYLLLTYRENQSLLPLFFIVGGLTSFFDLLTAPLITLGILLIVSILLDKKQRAFLNSLSWYIGYLLLWFSKLLIAHLSYSPGALQSAVAQLANRAVGVADEKFSLFNTVTLNVSQLIGYDRFNKIVVLSCGILFLLVLLRYFSFKTKRIKSILPWVFVGVLPYLWFLTLANHSYIHVWYTYRNQFMSVAAFFLIVAEFIDWIKVKKEVGFLKTKLKSLSSPLK